MASGWTTTASLGDSVPSMIAGARQVREHKGVMPQLVDHVKLGEGMGNTWTEVAYEKLTASAVNESSKDENPQELSDTPTSVTPSMVSISTFITDKVKDRLAKVAVRQFGALAQNAIQRKKDVDGLVMLDSATTSLVGANNTLSVNDISNASKRITSNATEPGEPPIYGVLHGYQIYDLYGDLVAGVGTYVVEGGVTADALRNGFQGRIHGVDIFEDGNITIDSSSDAKGGVFAKRGVIMVEGAVTHAEVERKPGWGGGGEIVYIRDDYAFGERSAGNWLYEIYSDATAPV